MRRLVNVLIGAAGLLGFVALVVGSSRRYGPVTDTRFRLLDLPAGLLLVAAAATVAAIPPPPGLHRGPGLMAGLLLTGAGLIGVGADRLADAGGPWRLLALPMAVSVIVVALRVGWTGRGWPLRLGSVPCAGAGAALAGWALRLWIL